MREVRARLDRTDAQAGDAEMLVVMLKSLVPQNIKAQFKTRMLMLSQPLTGNNFLLCLLNELNEEIKAQETDPRKQPAWMEGEVKDKAKVKSSKVLGRFYHSQKANSPVQSENKVSDETTERGATGKQE